MAKLSFQLTENSTEKVIKTSAALVDIWWFIKTKINEPRSYGVDELENGQLVDTVSAYYLVENFKDRTVLPLTISDII